MKKTNKGLVEYATAQLGNPYIYGTYGQILTEKILSEKSKQYPIQLDAYRVAVAKNKYIGKRCHDCIGLIKGFLWCQDANSVPKYKPSQDWNTEETYRRATESGSINTIPDIPGICVRYIGHVGVYIGNCEVIEAKGFNYGVVKSKLDGRWTDWYKHPLIEYGETDKYQSNITYIVKKGDTLSTIALRYNTTTADIAKDNNINDPNIIQVGQVINIRVDIPDITYVVKAGDTLSNIAHRYNTTVDNIAKLNNIEDVDIINVGQVLKLK